MSLYVFIDGAHFREAHRTAMNGFYNVVPAIDWPNLRQFWGSARRIYYYDAIDRNTQGSESDDDRDKRVAEHDRFHAYLNSLPYWSVREGFVSRGRRATRRTQKAVDVQLAVDAMEHAANHTLTQAVFVMGDLDFEPLLFSLGRFGVQTKVFYENFSVSPELLEAADERQQLTLATFYGMSEENFRISCPASSTLIPLAGAFFSTNRQSSQRQQTGE
jgi:uncharacterized LabA/DUF88 family protein